MRHSLWIGLALGLAAALGASPPVESAPPAHAGEAQADSRAATPDAYQSRRLQLLNSERTRHGLRPMRLSSCAELYAERWSSYLARYEVFRHQSLAPMLRTCRARQVGENIGNGSLSADAMMRTWMASAIHRANILNPRFTQIGLGAVRSSSGRWYAVQDFVGF